MADTDGEKPGADTGADDKSGGSADDGNASKKAGESDKGSKGGDDTGSKAVTFADQKAVDDMVQRRVERALEKSKKDAELSETDRLKKERDDANRLVQDRDNRDDFVAKADIAPAMARRLYNAYREDFDIDDKGKITNLDAVLKQAKTDFASLFQKKKVEGGGDGGKGGEPAGDANAALRNMWKR